MYVYLLTHWLKSLIVTTDCTDVALVTEDTYFTRTRSLGISRAPTSSCLTSSLWMWTRRRRTESHFLGVGCTLCPVQCSTLYGIYRCVSKLRFCIFPFTHICCVKYFAFLLSENLLGTMKMLWENSDVGRSPALSCCPDKSLWGARK